MLGAEVSDQLGDLLVGERLGEWRHLLAAVEYLVGNSLRGPVLVLAQASEVRPFFAAAAARAVAVNAVLVAEKESAGLLGGFGFGAEEGMGGERGKDDQGGCEGGGEKRQTGNHGDDFLIFEGWRASTFCLAVRAAASPCIDILRLRPRVEFLQGRGRICKPECGSGFVYLSALGANPKVTVTEKLRPAMRLGVSAPEIAVVALN